MHSEIIEQVERVSEPCSDVPLIFAYTDDVVRLSARCRLVHSTRHLLNQRVSEHDEVKIEDAPLGARDLDDRT